MRRIQLRHVAAEVLALICQRSGRGRPNAGALTRAPHYEFEAPPPRAFLRYLLLHVNSLSVAKYWPVPVWRGIAVRPLPSGWATNDRPPCASEMIFSPSGDRWVAALSGLE